jgi:hypothetical protein
MRSIFRTIALILVLLVPLVAYAGGGGPCPDDLELSKNCDNDPPPYYVVINRSVEYLDRPGTGCQPIILKHPDCTDCTGAACTSIDVEAEVCKPLLTGKVPAADPPWPLYEMCCACAANPDGDWMFRVRNLDQAGNCPVSVDNPDWIPGLPPSTGIDLPTPVIVGGLAIMGLALLVVGVELRRRTVKAI